MRATSGTAGLPFAPWLARLGAYVVWLAVSLPVVSLMPTTGERVVAAVLLAISGVLLGFFLTDQRSATALHLYLATQTVLVLAVYLIRPDAGLGVAQMMFLFSAQAVLFLPARASLPWVGLFAVITLVGGLYVLGSGMLLGVVATTGGNLVFAGLAAAIRQTQIANRRVIGLLDEVRQAHDQLRSLSEASERLAVAQERERIAREMHDALGHRLTVAIVHLEGAQRLLPTDPQRAGEMVATMREQLKDGLAELRDTVSTLRSPVESTLSVSLERLAEAFASATNLDVQLELGSDLPALDPDLHHALFRVAQEGLTNAQRHAEARRLQVSLRAHDGCLRLCVEDDGRGVGAEATEGRFGLAGIQERIAPWQGHMTLSDRPGGGAVLQVDVPLEKLRPATEPASARASGTGDVSEVASRA